MVAGRGTGVIWRAVNSFLQLRVPDMALSVFGLDWARLLLSVLLNMKFCVFICLILNSKYDIQSDCHLLLFIFLT